MENLFTTITKTLPKPKQQDIEKLKELDASVPEATVNGQELPLKKLVERWQRTNTPEDTETLLRRLQPTMRSAITSFAGGDTTLGVKAAKLSLAALKQYKSDMGADPTTFVFHNLKRLNRISGQRGNIIPRSEYKALEQRSVRRAFDTFVEERGREPSLSELADRTGLSKRKLNNLLNENAVVNENSTVSEETGALTLGKNALTDEDYFEYVYASVNPVDQKIMEWTSGLHNAKTLSNNQIAARLHISPAAVSQHKAKIQQMLSDVRGML